MKFCNVCQNMLYIQVKRSDPQEAAVMELHYNCKNCGFSYSEERNRLSAAVLEHSYDEDKHTTFNQYITPYIKYDPTLPRVDNIECPNKECGNKKRPEVIYMKVDSEAMKYVYYCCNCEHFWRSQ